MFERVERLGAVLREVGKRDAAICRSIFAETRADELTASGLDAAMVDQLITLQFKAREAQFAAAYPAMCQLMIVRDDQVIGKLCYDKTKDRVRLVDIALVGKAQGSGFGTAILEDLADDFPSCCIDLHVARDNPARRLFERVGFVTCSEGPVYARLERQPNVLQKREK